MPEALQLPDDLQRGLILLSMHGQEHLWIENFRGLSSYSSEGGFRAFKAGVCYPHQVVEELPADPFDVPVDHLCCGR